MNKTLHRKKSHLVIALWAASLAACSQPGSAEPVAQPASAALQALGVDAYVTVGDPAAAARYEVRLLWRGAEVGELAQEAEGDLRFSLAGQRLTVHREGDAMIFALGEETGTLTADSSGALAGDPAALALWKRATPQLDAIATIAKELRLVVTTASEPTRATDAVRCHANPMYVNGIYLNVLCPFNRVASCQSWLQNNCPFGRVCSSDSHPGDCFRGLEACGGYCDCSSYGTGCSVNSDCCSNNCASNGHNKACH